MSKGCLTLENPASSISFIRELFLQRGGRGRGRGGERRREGEGEGEGREGRRVAKGGKGGSEEREGVMREGVNY